MRVKQNKLARCENLEVDLADAQSEAKQAQCKVKRETDKIKKFWKIKIYEGAS